MRLLNQIYIDGAWVDPMEPRERDCVNPADEAVFARLTMCGAKDVDRAVIAARRAFSTWSQTTREDRVDVLKRVLAFYKARWGAFGEAISLEMGSPAVFAKQFHAGVGMTHLKVAIETLADFDFVERRGDTQVQHRPIGVCGLITPWNYPMNQILAKVAPALATGCTIVLKPSEVAPLSAELLAQVMHEAGVPAGVFNLVTGDAITGRAMCVHPAIDMISFTGSTAAGIEVAKLAADGVKRVAQELGGKSPYVILDDEDLAANVRKGVRRLMINSGQSCNAPSRLIVPRDRLGEVEAVARDEADKVTVGLPANNADIGPVASAPQWDKIQSLIASGLGQGARLVAGGLGRPEGLERGYYVRPTIFSGVTSDMRIVREEIFGPVLSIIGVYDLDEAIAVANDTEYGIAGYVAGRDPQDLQRVADGIWAGQVIVNEAPFDPTAPFGGMKRSGNGREWGAYGFHEFLELKAILGK